MAKETYHSSNETGKKPPRKGLVRLAIMLVAIVVMLGLAFGITTLIQKNTKPANTGPASQTQGSSTVDPATEPEPTPEPDPGQNAGLDSWNTLGPAVADVAAIDLVAPDYRMIAVPENGRVDISYFDTVTLVGDSLMQGFNSYKVLPNAFHASYKGVSPRAIYDGTQVRRIDGEYVIPLDEIVGSQPDNVYVMMGANALVSMNDDSYIEYFRQMLEAIQGSLSDEVKIYVLALTPVSPSYAGFAIPGYNSQHRLDELNNRLAKLAWEMGLYFVDITEVLKDDEGYLQEEYRTPDGLHLNQGGYEAWLEYLITHTVHHPRNPYLPGSPYYTG